MASARVEFPDTGHTRNYAQMAWDYAQSAIEDKRYKSHCKLVKQAARRFAKDLRRRKFDFVFDPWHANDVCDFIEKLPHVEGEWETRTITLEPWQCFVLCNIFGWRHKETNYRRFQMVYLELARKAAKSTLSAGVANYCLACENELGPQIVIGATTGQQADKVFVPAKRMIDRTPALQSAFGIETFSRSITCADNGGAIMPINSNSSTQDGWNPHVGILDELHAHKDRGLFDVIKSAFGARKQPLMWIITTAGYNTEGVCYEQRKMVAKVLNETIQAEHVFGMIFTLDKGDDPYDETKWIKANPMIGVTPTWDSMRNYAAEAKASPGVAYEFKTKRLNIWTTAKDAWLNMYQWDRCNKPFAEKDIEGLDCYAGIDLASTSDITALVVVWINPENEHYFVRAWFYLPEETIKEHIFKRSVPYQEWVDAGHITVTPGNTTDYAYIERDIRRIQENHRIKLIGYDPWNAGQLVANLEEEGANMIAVRQGAKSFNSPMRELDRAMRTKRLHHGGNPVLSWMASNVVCRFDPNMNMAPDKAKSHEKIDGMVALLEAIHASQLEVDPEFDAMAAIG